MPLTQVDQGLLNQFAQYTGFKNRIINGGMVIDQRNAGASVTPSASNTYLIDRWVTEFTQASKLTFQQNLNSVTPPSGFTNYLGVSVASTATVGASDYFLLETRVEGYNFADLAWGTANAQSATLSFWVRSSVTGTFGASFSNADASRAYPFTYAINAANTWEYKTVTVAGDTTGTWNTTNGRGLTIYLSLGTGSSFAGTAGAWVGASRFTATGATSIMGTLNATFYITGVQLERGSTATSFDFRPYGTELMLCQRYYWRRSDSALNTAFVSMQNYQTTDARGPISYAPMRAAPTFGFSTASTFWVQSFSATATPTAMQANSATQTDAYIIATCSGLTGGQASSLIRQTGTAFIDASAEL